MTLILDEPQVNAKYKPNKERKASENRRIEMVFQMDKRHRELLAAGDKFGLLELAAEYMVLGHGCPGMAAWITAESENL